MVTVDDKLYVKMPPEIKACFKELPNPSRDEVVELFPNSKGCNHSSKGTGKNIPSKNIGMGGGQINATYGDDGSASRFFYCAKASKSERNRGCEGLENGNIGAKGNGLGRVCETCGVSQLKPELCVCDVKSWVNPSNNKNNHPTVKPIALMEYLVKLVSREGAVVLDPFMGSGSTGIACKNLNRQFIGIEREPEYAKIAEARISACNPPEKTMQTLF